MEETPQSLTAALTDARAAAREQLAAVWQLQVDRTQEQMAAGWRDHLERVFDERFADLSADLAHAFERELSERVAAGVAARLTEVRDEAARERSDRLAQAVRRLRLAETTEEWKNVLLDSAAGFCRGAALLRVSGSTLALEGVRGAAGSTHEAAGMELALAAAPALAQVVESRDTVVAARTASELSEPLLRLFSGNGDSRACLFPIVVQNQAAAVLYTEALEGPIDVSALELVTVAAAMSLEMRRASQAAPAGLVGIAAPAASTNGVSQPALAWAALSREDQDLHIRAQRYSRVQVAEVRLYQSQAVKAGRANRNLYASLKEYLDLSREAFRLQFMEASPTMVDYLHLELVRTLANDDQALLGIDYPGPLA